MPALTKELWNTLKPLLDEALDLEESERSVYISRLRTESPVLARELEALLAGEAAADDLFLVPSGAAVLGTTLEGQQVGQYTLVRLIGRGGMGTVWLARRSDGRYEGEVAVKLLNVALVGRGGEERFAQEGRLLARLVHPNVARLIDAGVTNIGQPYLVLEHVTGEPIDEFADARRCTPEERIRLCCDVLAAVGAAHAALIVHRDIKPSNILVDAAGRVKLLDFGIAKLMLEGGGGVAGTLTDPAGRALTPDYAAPEIVRGEPVSTATDVYSVGVLLYVLLTGRHPTGAACRTPAEHIRALLEVEPPLLSVAIAGVAASSDAAGRLGAQPQQLARLYRGDLDSILEHALRKQPHERYSTAAAFADDLIRFTRHEPISARRDSWPYRARKFARRHRSGLAAAALVAVSLIGASGFSVSQMQAAQRQRARAEEALRRSAATTAFESLLFRLIEPGGEALTYRQLLDRGREALERQYRGDPVSRIQLRVQFAQNYLREGDNAAALSLLEQGVLIADSLGDAHWRARARCEAAVALTQNGMNDSAGAHIAAARAFLRSVRDVERGTANACDYAQAESLLESGRYLEAAALHGVIAGRFAASGDTTTDDYIYALTDQARAFSRGGRVRDAQVMMLHLLDPARSAALIDPRDVEVMTYNAATSFLRLGEYRSEWVLLQRQIAALSADSTAFMLPMLPYEYGMTLHRLEQFDSARFWLERALEDSTQLSRGGTVAAHLTLAAMARASGRVADAARHLAGADRLAASTLNDPAAGSARAMVRIQAAAAAGERSALPAVITAELERLGYSSNPNSIALLRPLLAGTTALLDIGDFGAAADYARRIEQIGAIDSIADAQSAIVGHGRYLQARAARGLGDTGRARTLIDAALAALAYGYGPGHSAHAGALALRDSLRN